MLGGYGDGPIGTAYDGALVVKGIGAAEIDVTMVSVLVQKALLDLAPEILGGGACGGSFTAVGVDRAGRGSRTARFPRGRNACGIRDCANT